MEKFIKDAESQAKKLLTKRKILLEKLAKTLIKKETIEREEFEELIGKRSTPTFVKKEGEEIIATLPKKGKSIKVKIRRV